MKATISSFRLVRSSGTGDIQGSFDWYCMPFGKGAPVAGAAVRAKRCATLTVSSTAFDPDNALLQRICGLPGPRTYKKAAGWESHRDQGQRRGPPAGPYRAAGRTEPGGPHQRRGARDPGGLFRGNAEERRQLPGDVSQGKDGISEEVQGCTVSMRFSGATI